MSQTEQGRFIAAFAQEMVEIPPSLQILDGIEEPSGAGVAAFRILNGVDGDRRIQWFKDNLQSLVEARDLFNELVSKGMVPYRVNSGGDKTTEIMKQFDPEAEEVVFLPMQMVVGG